MGSKIFKALLLILLVAALLGYVYLRMHGPVLLHMPKLEIPDSWMSSRFV